MLPEGLIVLPFVNALTTSLGERLPAARSWDDADDDGTPDAARRRCRYAGIEANIGAADSSRFLDFADRLRVLCGRQVATRTLPMSA